MRKKQSAPILLDHWPIPLCILSVLVTFLFLFLDNPDRPEKEVSAIPGRTISSRESNLQEPSFPNELIDSVVHGPAPVGTSLPTGMGQRVADATESIPSPLETRTADWRYVGAALSQSRRVAVIQKMKQPDRKWRVVEGERLDGVTVEKIQSDSIQVALEGQTDRIPLTQGPAFSAEEVFIPEDALHDPEVVAAVVFAQTLGKYVAEEPDFSSVGTPVEPESDSLHDMMEVLSKAGKLVPPMRDEPIDGWGEAVAEEMSSNPNKDLDPSQHPLSEESRLTILGLRRTSTP